MYYVIIDEVQKVDDFESVLKGFWYIKNLDIYVTGSNSKYGGLPRILSFKTEEEKSKYLINLFTETYLKDIVERYNIQRTDILDSLVNMISSCIGSLP